MKALDELTDFSLLLIEQGGWWVLRIRYEILLPERKQHERYLISYRGKIKHWRILDNAIAFIRTDKRLKTFNSLQIIFESGLFLTTEGSTP